MLNGGNKLHHAAQSMIFKVPIFTLIIYTPDTTIKNILQNINSSSINLLLSAQSSEQKNIFHLSSIK